MISRKEMQAVASSYEEPCIGVLGSHSALEIASGARKEGLKTVVICQMGREKTYSKYYKNLFDEIVILDRFSEITKKDTVKRLVELSTVFIPNRSFSVYVGYNNIENSFSVPIFGSRALLRAEERDEKRNQYYLLDKAGIKRPEEFKNPEEIDRLCIIKIMQKGSVERAFFFASSPWEFEKKAQERVKSGLISKEGLKNAVIEEYVLGALFNANFFYSPLSGEIELLGFDRRIQTNLDGLLKLPAKEQPEISETVQNIEVGHMPATMRESQLEKVFEAAESFVSACKKEYPPGLFGLFALQGSINKKLEFVVFDCSLRVPGSPILESVSPYTSYKYGEIVSPGRRVAMEVKRAAEEGKLGEIVT